MSVVRAQIQTVEEIYQLVWTAVVNKQPMEATYQGGIDYSAHTDWAGTRKGSFACCVISTAAIARPDFGHQVRSRTGVVSRSKNSAG
jgi:hypothetical protein